MSPVNVVQNRAPTLKPSFSFRRSPGTLEPGRSLSRVRSRVPCSGAQSSLGTRCAGALSVSIATVSRSARLVATWLFPGSSDRCRRSASRRLRRTTSTASKITMDARRASQWIVFDSIPAAEAHGVSGNSGILQFLASVL